jgi:hypothetical protein
MNTMNRPDAWDRAKALRQPTLIESEQLQRLLPELGFVRWASIPEAWGWKAAKRYIGVIEAQDPEVVIVEIFCGFSRTVLTFNAETVEAGLKAAIRVAPEIKGVRRAPKHLQGREKWEWKMKEKRRYQAENSEHWLAVAGEIESQTTFAA